MTKKNLVTQFYHLQRRNNMLRQQLENIAAFLDMMLPACDEVLYDEYKKKSREFDRNRELILKVTRQIFPDDMVKGYDRLYSAME